MTQPRDPYGPDGVPYVPGPPQPPYLPPAAPYGQPAPQMPLPQPPAAMPKRGMATWKILAIVGGSLLGLCCVSSVIVGLVVGPPKNQPVAHNAVAARPTTTVAKAPTPTTPAAAPTTTKPALPPPTTRPAVPTTAAKPAAPPDREICRVDENGGSYYLLVTSADLHDFRACAGAALYNGTIDDLLNLPAMDRRCILGNDSIAVYHALVAAYSDTKSADLAAARSFCDANGGTNG